MLREEAEAARRRADIAAQLHLRHPHHAGGYLRASSPDARRSDPGWRYFEIDASHTPNVTAPETLMALLEKIALFRVSDARSEVRVYIGVIALSNPLISE